MKATGKWMAAMVAFALLGAVPAMQGAPGEAPTESQARKTAVLLPAKSLRAALLREIGLRCDWAEDLPAALADPGCGLVVADASPAALERLAGAKEALKTFTDRGGWLMLWGLEPEGLAHFNQVVGVEHLLRPFEMARVNRSEMAGEFMEGIGDRYLIAFGQATWGNYQALADDIFTYVVDYDDIAPFCKFPGPGYWNDPDARPGTDRWPRNMVNGLVTVDHWRFIFSIHLDAGDPHKWTIELPRREEIVEFAIAPNTIYHEITKVRLVLDEDEENALEFRLEPWNERQDFDVPAGRQAARLTIDLAEWEESGRANVMGVDNIWIKVKRSPEFYKKVKPLVNVGGLVRYDMGEGGVLLNQLKIIETEKRPEWRRNKNVTVARLLRNMGAEVPE